MIRPREPQSGALAGLTRGPPPKAPLRGALAERAGPPLNGLKLTCERPQAAGRAAAGRQVQLLVLLRSSGRSSLRRSCSRFLRPHGALWRPLGRWHLADLLLLLLRVAFWLGLIEAQRAPRARCAGLALHRWRRGWLFGIGSHRWRSGWREGRLGLVDIDAIMIFVGACPGGNRLVNEVAFDWLVEAQAEFATERCTNWLP